MCSIARRPTHSSIYILTLPNRKNAVHEIAIDLPTATKRFYSIRTSAPLAPSALQARLLRSLLLRRLLHRRGSVGGRHCPSCGSIMMGCASLRLLLLSNSLIERRCCRGIVPTYVCTTCPAKNNRRGPTLCRVSTSKAVEYPRIFVRFPKMGGYLQTFSETPLSPGVHI